MLATGTTDTLLDTQIYGDMVGLPSDAIPAVIRSRKVPWLPHRFGFVGSRTGYDHLRFECETLILDPDLASSLLAAGMLDAIILEGAADEVSEKWQDGFFDFGRGQGSAHTLLEEARGHGVPVVAYLNGPPGRVPLFLPLAHAATYVVVTSAQAQKRLADEGIVAHRVPTPVQTALFNGFSAFPGEPELEGILSCDLARAANDSRTLELLRSLIPFGLRICGPGEHVQALALEDLKPVAEALEGTVTSAQLEALLVEHHILVQISNNERDDGAAWQIGLNAAAARCAVLVLGQPDSDDPRSDIATFCKDANELRAHISRLVMNPILAEKHRQLSWRKAHQNHGAHHFARLVAELCELDCPSSFPRASIVSPSYRPHALPAILENFRSQTWPERELIILANTDNAELWDTSLLASDGSEQIIFLARNYAAGMAMELGGARARGDYVMRMDDDDCYGPAYVEDMMLAASALAPDIMGKPPVFFYYVDENKFMYWTERSMKPSAYESRRIAEPGIGHLSGFTHTIRRGLLDRIGFSTKTRVAADAGFLNEVRDDGQLLCVVTDAMNAVIVRRSDLDSHTWRKAPASSHSSFRQVPVSLKDFLSAEDSVAQIG